MHGSIDRFLCLLLAWLGCLVLCRLLTGSEGFGHGSDKAKGQGGDRGGFGEESGHEGGGMNETGLRCVSVSGTNGRMMNEIRDGGEGRNWSSPVSAGGDGRGCGAQRRGGGGGRKDERKRGRKGGEKVKRAGTKRRREEKEKRRKEDTLFSLASTTRRVCLSPVSCLSLALSIALLLHRPNLGPVGRLSSIATLPAPAATVQAGQIRLRQYLLSVLVSFHIIIIVLF